MKRFTLYIHTTYSADKPGTFIETVNLFRVNKFAKPSLISKVSLFDLIKLHNTKLYLNSKGKARMGHHSVKIYFSY